MPVLDTTFLIALRAKEPRAVDLLRNLRGEDLVVPPWVVVEYATGLPESPEQVIEDLGRSFFLLETSRGWAAEAARLRRDLRRGGKRMRVPDFWIASFAVHLNTQVITRDAKEFKALGAEVVTW